jgi:hypothetical protein
MFSFYESFLIYFKFLRGPFTNYFLSFFICLIVVPEVKGFSASEEGGVGLILDDIIL